jgi:hypothetical protein
MSWRAGAEFTMMEKSQATSFGSPHGFQPYSHGNAINSWVPCTLVDASGKEIPWVDRDGRVLQTVTERCMPAPGQKFLGERTPAYNHKRPELIPDLEERIRKGEFLLPLYADLASMSEHERKVIWGHMVGEEGKTRVPVYIYYTEAGFDPSRDLLQSYLFLGSDPMRGSVRPQDRTGGEIGDAGGLVTDWNLMTSLEGYFAAGDALFAANYHYHAAVTGRYAGKKAAAYASKTRSSEPNRSQIEREKTRVYGPLENREEIEWKELNAAACRIMQNYCGEFKSEKLLEIALLSTQELQDSENHRVCVDNPHKLMRALEVYNILTCNEMIIHASMARKRSCPVLGFNRLDDPLDGTSNEKGWIVLRNKDGRIEKRFLPLDFWSPLSENYEKQRERS